MKMNVFNYILPFFFFFFPLIVNGQANLVPNSSFEDYSDCSTSPLINSIDHWFIPVGGGSSDYFNSCINPVWPMMGVPANTFGFQMPHTGNGYCGFGTYEDNTDAKEYLTVKLTELLEKQTYCLGFWISLSDSSSYETDRFYAYFSANNPNLTNDEFLVSEAQIIINTGFGVSSNSWTYYESEFLAVGGEEYITLGNFQQNSEVNFSFIGQNQIPRYAYYYIDDVQLQSCGDFNVPNVITPNKDGINDSLIISGITDKYSLQIYNRWGAEVFHTESPDVDVWCDEKASDGVYFLIISSKKENKAIYKGTVHVFH